MILNPFVKICAHSSLVLFAFTLFGHQIHLANAQTASTDVYVYVNDTAKWTTSGERWTLNKTLGNYASNWLIATRAPGATAPLTASFTFNGTAIAIFGTVDDGVQNESLNFSIRMDNTGDPVQPTYSPQRLASGLDVNYKIFEQSSLQFTTHNVTLTLTGQTTPFYIQGAVYSLATSPTLSMPASPSATSSSPPNTNSPGDDAAKLGGAIGGGVGALLLVALIIFFMIRRIKRIEQNERKLQARPFTAPSRENNSRAGSVNPTPSVRSAPRTSTSRDQKKKKKFPASSSNPSISEKEKLVRRDGGAPSSSRSHTQSHSRSQSQQTHVYANSQLVHTQSYHSITQHQLAPRPDVAVIGQQPSPPGSVISLPSEYQATTTIGNRGPGTAVASSYIGPSPLPQDDAPPLPAFPTSSEMDAMVMTKKGKSSRTQHVHQPSHPPPPPFEEVVPLRDYPRDVKNPEIFYPPTPARSIDPRRTSAFTTSSVTTSSVTASSMVHTPSSGPALGLFSTDSVNTIGTESTGTGRRPLPVPPLPRNIPVSTHSFPPEKVGLSPPPTSKKPPERRSSIAKRPLPLADPPSG